MAYEFELHFRREPDVEPACVDYALIPEGIRRTLVLDNGQTYGCRRDNVGEAVITHVNLFALSNPPFRLEEPWLFPLAGPPKPPLIGATVDVLHDEIRAVVRYADGTCSETWKHKLGQQGPDCEPTAPGMPCQQEPCEPT